MMQLILMKPVETYVQEICFLSARMILEDFIFLSYVLQIKCNESVIL